MSRVYNFYKTNTNGIIITLIFHIIVFLFLYLSQLGGKNQLKETEIQIDFSQIELPKDQPQKTQESEPNKGFVTGELKTNFASNRSSSKQNKIIDEQYEKEIEEAQNLLKEVNQQLKREIPTIDNLKMPDAPKAKPEDLKDKTYTGESNIEYYLENRYHIKLPVPVYLAQQGGKVKVIIIVDRSGDVLKAEPVIDPGLSEQVLSYAKTAALRTIFNSSDKAPEDQQGYIIYNFIAQ
jgi:hypothetical protein